ncbi:hypothetical protein [Martelella mediterranea]|uniref:Biotin carboxyl carrier protein of acetyl-CoA carboxylase n=1 Tax=Martelella mediterranea DSM 17316 TaxID=1122214 RepID=A0A1U9Z0A1_9HYPH|nr:hypothetical protein [Martelella mediterranea]AQZ51070.1 hypothetical protein Mame_01723 [Martelella mediterranea DSM 17316]
MFSETELETLSEGMRQTGIRELRIDGVDGFLELVLPEAEHQASLVTGPAPTTRVSVRSLALGLFQPCGDDDGLSAVSFGSSVRAGQIIGYVADGCVRAPIEAPASGVIASDIPASGTVVGYCDILFELEAQP